MEDFVDSKGRLVSGITNNDLDAQVVLTSSIFETTPGYDNSDVYIYDDTRKGINNFSNLNTLTKGC